MGIRRSGKPRAQVAHTTGQTRRRAMFAVLLAVATNGSPRIAHAQFITKFLWLDRPAEKVTWRNDSVRLSGVLVVPNSSGRHPAVVLVHGAGKETHKQHALTAHANAFLARGFAVLLYDKRGSGESTGDLGVADFADLAGDLSAGVRMLRERSDIDPERIGFLGRSEGGWVAPLAAMSDPRIAFVIMSSGSAVAPVEQNLYWIAGRVHAHGGTDAQVAAAQAARRRVWEYYRDLSTGKVTSTTTAELRDSIGAGLSKSAPLLPEMGTRVWTPERQGMPLIRATANQQFYDPMVALRAMNAPVLAVLGEKDDVVQPASTLAALESLRKDGHRVETRVFPGVGHPLTKSFLGVMPRYATGYLDLVTSWAADIVGRPAAKR